MRILHTVEHYPPFIGGMSEVVKQISNYLVKFGHDVTVATTHHPDRSSTSIHGVNVKGFQITGNAVSGIQGEQHPYQQFLLEGNFDVIVNFAAQQWATDLTFPLLQQFPGKKVFVPTGFSALHNPDFQVYFSFLAEVMKQYDMNIFLSAEYQDIQFAHKACITKYCIIPNGASAEEFLPPTGNISNLLNIPDSHFIILHVGSHTGLKGHREAIEIFFQAQIENATLIIIGNPLEPECLQSCRGLADHLGTIPDYHAKGKKILLPHLTRKETIMAYQAADLFLFPSNIECSPIVLFECMASKTPFLTTDVGNATEIIKWSGGGMVLPTTKDPWGFSHAQIPESATLLTHLYQNPEKRHQMANAGFSAWEEKFTWEKIARSYEDIYLKLVPEKSPNYEENLKTPRPSLTTSEGVSVIIPTYNRRNTIEASIRSALQQTHPVTEILVCDDGSTDDTQSIINSIGDQRIKWLGGEHMGRPAFPRNRGIRAATGEWLAFLDSDDQWHEEKIATQLAHAKKNNSLALCCNANRFSPSQGMLGHLLDQQNEILRFSDLIKVNQVICSSVLLHRSLLPIVFGFPEEMEVRALEDYALWLRVATQTDFLFVNSPLLIYRDDPASSIRAKDQNLWLQRRYVFHNFLHWAQPQWVSKEYINSALQMYDEALKIIFNQ